MTQLTPVPPGGLLTVREAAQHLGCSRQHVYNLIASRRLKAADIGIGRAMTRVRLADLDTYLTRTSR